MSELFVPNMNCANLILPYPEEIAKKTGSSGMIVSIREIYLLLARQVDDSDPQEAAALREIADYYPDIYRGELMERDSRGNWVGDANDWDELTDEEKIHRGNANAAIAALDWLRHQLEGAAYDYSTVEDVTRVRRELSAIAI
ncbi:hypothetical protein GGQ64_004578 [Rhizobium azooxidifex]|uniref:Uncharacterized protein n=1 Tax=Mycoplana azooxidifex TaxID=1636188 RepID=A0A7W6GLK6_9HYPH|nr:hypothetical protein [Mycoplana azooxidifex]MBB3979338.1 hypothetical protein [Mycoplana azooxidifex]